MNYHTPQIHQVGRASALIQTKQQPGTDNNLPGHIVAASNLLDK